MTDLQVMILRNVAACREPLANVRKQGAGNAVAGLFLRGMLVIEHIDGWPRAMLTAARREALKNDDA